MGIGPLSSGGYPASDQFPPVPSGNPNPSNYKILDAEQVGDYLLVKIKFPDCNNYEGDKVLVYHGVKLHKLIEQKLIDPHFTNNDKYYSPLARFEPTDWGWFCAMEFCLRMDFLTRSR